MSARGKLVTAVVAGAALTLVAGVPGALAQGPWVAPPEAKSLKNPVKGVGDAKKVVETNCVTCHGASGHGDGPAAAALPPPKPANWTSVAVQKQTDGEIFWKISNGRGAMPPWKHLPEKERWEVVNYIRSLKGK
ncbi:MAG: cytochrome c class I [Candidatus Rokuibacteriota bacterium]|nr:MAG: cytochrome c class I [Candidatus Rokubacteria bacterium]PYN65434.1 MAG: cytochrome c class I [Candidatus Rokubacteria bacterium]